jgi:hypothetical protein
MTVLVPINDDRPSRASHHFESREFVVRLFSVKVDTSATVEQSFLPNSEKMKRQRIATVRAGNHVRDAVSIEIPELGIK